MQRIKKFVFSNGDKFIVEPRPGGLCRIVKADGTVTRSMTQDEARASFRQYLSWGHTYVDDSESMREMSEWLDDCIDKTGKVMAISTGTASAFGATALTGGGIGLALAGTAIGIPAIAVAGIAGSIVTITCGIANREPRDP